MGGDTRGLNGNGKNTIKTKFKKTFKITSLWSFQPILFSMKASFFFHWGIQTQKARHMTKYNGLFLFCLTMIEKHLTYFFTLSCWKYFLLCFWNTLHSNFVPANQQFLLNLFSCPIPCGLRMEYIKCCLWALYCSHLSLGGIVHFHVFKWQLNANYFNIMSSVLKMPSNCTDACFNSQISQKYFKLNVSGWNSRVSFPSLPNLNFPQHFLA